MFPLGFTYGLVNSELPSNDPNRWSSDAGDDGRGPLLLWACRRVGKRDLLDGSWVKCLGIVEAVPANSAPDMAIASPDCVLGITVS